MGIPGLRPYVKSVCETIDLTTFEDQVMLVDISIYLRTYLHSGDGSISMIVSRLNDQVKLLLSNGIVPVYIFDGSGYRDVKLVVEKRAKRITGNQNKIEELRAKQAADVVQLNVVNNDDDKLVTEVEPINTNTDLMSTEAKIKSLEVANRCLTKDIITSCKQLLDANGVSWIQATGEADTLISWIQQSIRDNIFNELTAMLPNQLLNCKKVYVLSTDSDMLTYGCETCVTEITTGTTGSNSAVATVYRLSRVLEHLCMTREMFVDFCILCGCDYASKITGIGIKKAHALIVKHHTIEAIIEYINGNEKLKIRHVYPAEFIEQYQIARNMFLLHSSDGEPKKLFV